MFAIAHIFSIVPPTASGDLELTKDQELWAGAVFFFSRFSQNVNISENKQTNKQTKKKYKKSYENKQMNKQTFWETVNILGNSEHFGRQTNNQTNILGKGENFGKQINKQTKEK